MFRILSIIVMLFTLGALAYKLCEHLEALWIFWLFIVFMILVICAAIEESQIK